MNAWDLPGSPQLFTAFNTPPTLFLALNREIMGLAEGVKCDQITFSHCWEESLARKCQTKPRGTEKIENSNYWTVHNCTQFQATHRQTAVLGNLGTCNVPVSHYLLPIAYSWKNMYNFVSQLSRRTFQWTCGGDVSTATGLCVINIKLARQRIVKQTSRINS